MLDHLLRAGTAIAGALYIAGCASLSSDGGFSKVQAIVNERGGQHARWVRTDAERDAVNAMVHELLSRPLSIEDAVRIAVVNNRGLQARFAELGIAETELVEASWPRNPGFAFSRIQGGGDTEIERSIAFEIVSLLTIPLRTRLERDRLAATQFAVAADIVEVVAEARRAYVRAIAARQTLAYTEDVRTAADASAELARRMLDAGNFSKLDQAREQIFYVDALARVTLARQAATSEREALIRVLGLSRSAARDLTLPERLPDLPADVSDSGDIEAHALEQRLDVQAARKDVESLAASLGLTRTTRFVNVLEIGYRSKSETGMPRKNGYEIRIELPLFDWTGAKVARAEYRYMQGFERAVETAMNAQSEIREAYARYRAAYDLARHYRDEVVPLRKRIAEESLLRYNGMLISVFELLADARERIVTVNVAIEALRDFWLAQTDLQIAMTGTSPALHRVASRRASD